MLSPTYEITTALSHTDELISPPYDIAIVTISYGRVTMSSVWDSMMSKKNMGWPFYAAVIRRPSQYKAAVFPPGQRCGPQLRIPDSKVHVANMGSTWVLSAPGGPHVGPMNLAIRDVFSFQLWTDPRLTWDPADYEGTQYFSLSAKDIWVPNIGLRNRYTK